MDCLIWQDGRERLSPDRLAWSAMSNTHTGWEGRISAYAAKMAVLYPWPREKFPCLKLRLVIPWQITPV